MSYCNYVPVLTYIWSDVIVYQCVDHLTYYPAELIVGVDIFEDNPQKVQEVESGSLSTYFLNWKILNCNLSKMLY